MPMWSMRCSVFVLINGVWGKALARLHGAMSAHVVTCLIFTMQRYEANDQTYYHKCCNFVYFYCIMVGNTQKNGIHTALSPKFVGQVQRECRFCVNTGCNVCALFHTPTLALMVVLHSSSGFSKGGLNHRARRMQSSMLELLSRSRWCQRPNGAYSPGQAKRHPGFTWRNVMTPWKGKSINS